MTLLSALDATVGALDPAELDAAAVELARLYAEQIDSAHGVGRFAAHVMAQVEQGDDVDLIDQVRALRGKLTERETLDRIGARLHALLVELGATPKSRAGAGGAKTPAAGPSTLHMLRGGAAV